MNEFNQPNMPPPNMAPPYTPYSPYSREERMWAAFCHLSAFLTILLPSFGQIIGPLVVWLLKREDSAFIDAHGKEALNFNISYFIYLWISIFLTFFLIGIVLLPLVVITWLVCVIIAAVKANDGQKFDYPLVIRFL